MQTQKNILLILNPIAGGSDKKPIRQAFLKHCTSHDVKAEVYETTGDQDVKSVSQLLESLKPDRVFISGGDGTLREFASLLMGTDIQVGILPSGSANGLAYNLGIPSDLEAQLNIAFGTRFIDLDTLSINNTPCLHIADVGVNAQLIQNYEEAELRGKLGYLLQVFPTLFKGDFPFEVTITANGQTFRREAILVGVCNAQKFGTGANINPQGKLDDGKFEVLVFKNFSLSQILKTFYGDAPLDPNFVEVISCQEVDIINHKPLAFQIDGEFMGRPEIIHAKMNSEKIKIAVDTGFDS